MALMLLELGINSHKYGSQSVKGGQVSIACAIRSDLVTIRWSESGGPSVQVDSEFREGVTLASSLTEFNLGGRFEVEFAADGIVVTIQFAARAPDA